MKPRRTRLDDRFWRRFAKENWQRKPGVFRNIDSPLNAIDAATVFRWLVAYSDLCRRKKTADGFKLYIEGRKQFPEEVLELLPLRSDLSLEGYHQRMSEMFADYCLVCDELIQVSGEQWSGLNEFTQGLYREVGLPNRFAEIGLYLGNYRKTPFGVHIDACGVFSMPVVGRKNFRVWGSSYVEKNPRLKLAQSYAPFKQHSRLLEATSGDMTYWPSSSWHIAESDGSFNVTWSIGVWVDRPYLDVLQEILAPLLAETFQRDAATSAIPFSDAKLPTLLADARVQLSRLPDVEVQAALARFWLVHSSRRGFKTAPLPRKPVRWTTQTHLAGVRECPLAWLIEKDRLCVAVHGEVLKVANTAKNRALVTTINRAQNFLHGRRTAAEKKILALAHRHHALIRL